MPARSNDGGITFRNHDWSDRSFAGDNADFRDEAYIGDLKSEECGLSGDELMWTMLAR